MATVAKVTRDQALCAAMDAMQKILAAANVDCGGTVQPQPRPGPDPALAKLKAATEALDTAGAGPITQEKITAAETAVNAYNSDPNADANQKQIFNKNVADLKGNLSDATTKLGAATAAIATLSTASLPSEVDNVKGIIKEYTDLPYANPAEVTTLNAAIAAKENEISEHLAKLQAASDEDAKKAKEAANAAAAQKKLDNKAAGLLDEARRLLNLAINSADIAPAREAANRAFDFARDNNMSTDESKTLQQEITKKEKELLEAEKKAAANKSPRAPAPNANLKSTGFISTLKKINAINKNNQAFVGNKLRDDLTKNRIPGITEEEKNELYTLLEEKLKEVQAGGRRRTRSNKKKARRTTRRS